MERKLENYIRGRRSKGDPIRTRHVMAYARKWAEEERQKIIAGNKANGQGDKQVPVFVGTNDWKRAFRKRARLSLRRPTNRKSASTKERVPRMRRFHRSLRKLRAAMPGGKV